jgi:hypothetical protein
VYPAPRLSVREMPLVTHPILRDRFSSINMPFPSDWSFTHGVFSRILGAVCRVRCGSARRRKERRWK